MNPLYLNVVLFALGWLLFMLAQAQNSVLSKSNGLPPGWPGIAQYLKVQAINLGIRALVSGAFYPVIVQNVTSKLTGAGFTLHSAGVAAVSGLAANAIVYQASGLLPWLRTEVSNAVPPPNVQIVPGAPPAPPAPPSTEAKS